MLKFKRQYTNVNYILYFHGLNIEIILNIKTFNFNKNLKILSDIYN